MRRAWLYDRIAGQRRRSSYERVGPLTPAPLPPGRGGMKGEGRSIAQRRATSPWSVPFCTITRPSTVSVLPGRDGSTPKPTLFEPPAHVLVPAPTVPIPAGLHPNMLLSGIRVTLGLNPMSPTTNTYTPRQYR